MLRRGFKIAVVQMKVGSNKAENIKNATSEIVCARTRGAEMVVLPECFNSPYGTQFFKEYAEKIPCGETSKAMSKIAKEAGICLVAGSIPEEEGGKLYNTCTVWGDDGQLLAKHRKVHLFDIDIPGKVTFRESDVLSPGNKLTTFDYKGATIGVGICYDLRFPEMAQLMAKDGCGMLIYPAAFNTTTGPKHFELLGRGRANDNQLWVVLASPARDTSAGYVAYGGSCVIDPWAKVVECLDEKPGVIFADIDMKAVEEAAVPLKWRRAERRRDVPRFTNQMACNSRDITSDAGLTLPASIGDPPLLQGDPTIMKVMEEAYVQQWTSIG